MQNIFQSKSTIQSSHKIGEPVTLNFELTNSTQDDYFALKWNNPLEGLFSGYVVIKRNGTEIKYDGPFLKRGNPLKEEYLLVKAGKSVNATINLAQAYYFDEAGEYEITINAGMFDHMQDESGDKTCKPRKINDFKAYPLASNTLKINIAEGAEPIKTSGMIQREKEGLEPLRTKAEAAALLKRKECLETLRNTNSSANNVTADSSSTDSIVAPKAPTVVDTTGSPSSDVEKQIKKAHYTAYQWCQAGYISFFNNQEPATYFILFGNYPGNVNIAQSTYRTMYEYLESYSMAYNISYYYPSEFPDPGPDPLPNSAIALTHYRSEMIYLFHAFFLGTSGESLAGFQAATVVHELSHAASDIEDIVYGFQNCLNLAHTNPKETVNNADTYAYYVQDGVFVTVNEGITVFHQNGAKSGKLYYSTSFVPGEWYPDTPVEASNSAIMSYSPSVIAYNRGNTDNALMCLYQENGGGRGIKYNFYRNQEWTAGSISGTSINHSPSATNVGATIYCMYQKHDADLNLYIVSCYDSNFAQWSSPQQVPNAKLSYSPSVTGYNNSLYCFYHSDEGEDLWFNYTTDTSRSQWAGNIKVPSATIKTSPSVVVYEGRFYCFYQSTSGYLSYATVSASEITSGSQANWHIYSTDIQISNSPGATVRHDGSLYCFYAPKDGNEQLVYSIGSIQDSATGYLIFPIHKTMLGVKASANPAPIGVGFNSADINLGS